MRSDPNISKLLAMTVLAKEVCMPSERMTCKVWLTTKQFINMSDMLLHAKFSQSLSQSDLTISTM